MWICLHPASTRPNISWLMQLIRSWRSMDYLWILQFQSILIAINFVPCVFVMQLCRGMLHLHYSYVRTSIASSKWWIFSLQGLVRFPSIMFMCLESVKELGLMESIEMKMSVTFLLHLVFILIVEVKEAISECHRSRYGELDHSSVPSYFSWPLPFLPTAGSCLLQLQLGPDSWDEVAVGSIPHVLLLQVVKINPLDVSHHMDIVRACQIIDMIP